MSSIKSKRQSKNVGKRVKVPSAVNSNKNLTCQKDKSPQSAPEHHPQRKNATNGPLQNASTPKANSSYDNRNSKKTKSCSSSSLEKSSKALDETIIKPKSITANASKKTKSGRRLLLSTTKHKASSAVGTTNKESGQSSDSGSTKAKNGGDLLLTARHHRNSLTSPGEAVISPYGEVQTMVCEVSPVPSDVESIDCFRTSKSQTKGQLTVGRSQQTLKVGHCDKSSSFSLLSKTRHSYSGNCASTRKPITTPSKNNKNEDPPLIDSSLQRSNNGSATATTDVAVRIVSDSAKSTTQPPVRKDTPLLEGGKPQVKAGNKVKEIHKQQQQQTNAVKIIPTKSVLSSSKINIRSSKVKKDTNLPKTQPLQDSCPEEIKEVTNPSTALHVPSLGKNEESEKPDEQQNSEQGTSLDELLNTTQPMENTISATAQNNEKHLEERLNTEIPADAECRKAYIILNKKGFNVSLNTLRRALLTPTDYRKIQAINKLSHL